MYKRYSCSVRFSIMFGRRKDGKGHPTHERPRHTGMPQLGLLDMGGYDYDPASGYGVGDGDDDDAGLEDELLAITSGKAPTRARRGKGSELEDLDSMIKQSLRDLSSDEDEELDDGDLENDPELLAELQQLTPEESPLQSPVLSPTAPIRPAPLPPTTEQPLTSSSIPPKDMTTLLEDRINMYRNAVANAKTAGDSSKTRRLERGIKTLEALLKNAKAGKTISEESIPPEVATGAPKVPAPTTEILEPKILPTAPESPEKLIDISGSPIPDYEMSSRETASSPIPELPPRSTPQPPRPPPPKPESSPKPSPIREISMRVDPTPELSPKRLPEDLPMSEQSTNAEEEEKKNIHHLLVNRKRQYQQAALNAKKNGDSQSAVKFIKTAKQFEVVISAMEQGQPIDLSQMPPPPPGIEDNSGGIPLLISSPASSTKEGSTNTSEEEPLDPSVFKAPPPPSSTLEALEQRREKYLTTMKEAEEAGNSSKSRRMGRLVKQYDDAIKNYKAGKPVPYDDLPDPPGFAPIPREGSQKPAAVPQVPAAPTAPKSNKTQGPPEATPGPSAVPKPAGGQRKPGIPVKKSAMRSIHEKQFAELQERQRLFRDAALCAKKRGDIELAKEYLRKSKGFNQMIEASKCGLPVDLDRAPIPPQRKSEKDNGFEVIEVSDCVPPGDREETYERLENELKAQIAMCTRNRDHFSQLGDIHSSRKFQLMAEHTNKDLTFIKYAFKRGDPVPRFGYEMKIFNIVHCFTDLNDNELELTIVRGINYSCSNPKDIDTYVRFEFPYPSDNCPKDRTQTVKDTNNPEYNKSFMLTINRKARAVLRAIKRNAIKLEVMAKGGFFHSDNVLGTVNVKLLPLETKCMIHECFDLMDGRKVVGGKLEVKIRIREPMVSKQVEQMTEKWLVIKM